jgi:hypothetical protein
MVLNTSFNTLPSEPIVETPSDAIRSFLCSMGTIQLLVMGDYVIKRKDSDVRRLLGEKSADGIAVKPSNPKKTGPVSYQTSFTVVDDEPPSPKTKVSMPDRPMHDERTGSWYELLDDLEGEILGVCNGKVSVNDIMNQYLIMSDESMGESAQDEEYQEILFSNILRRLIRLYEHTLIKW